MNISIHPTLSLRRLAMVLIPLAVALAYIFFFSVELYRSESAYVVRDLSSTQELGVDLGILGVGASSGKQDVSIVMEYLRSQDVLKQVDARYHLDERYHSSRTDILDRLWSWSSSEDFLGLYRKRLNVWHDDLTGITHIAFDSSDRKLARDVLVCLLDLGVEFLNNLNRQRAATKTRVAGDQLRENRAALDAAIADVEAFQSAHQLVDPAADVSVQNSIIANLEGSLVQKTAEYNQLRSYMSGDSLEVEKVSRELAEIRAALHKAKNRLTGRVQGPLNERMFEFQRLKDEVTFATKAYEQTLIQYEVAKIEADKESKMFETISTPTFPDGHVFPQRARATATAVFLIFALAKILQLLWAVVQDHKD